ncbi:hypothetical protein [Brevundimonas sp. GCM10030266]|uniref:hypothetical protein n=1 Tax=Brevundimonas sp. GCM10030266 TaxID=3273386 RepID=UPI0036145979
MLVLAASASLSGCAMTVDTSIVGALPDGSAHAELRIRRDATAFLDDSNDSGELWAINRSSQAVCFKFGPTSYAASYQLVPPGREVLLRQYVNSNGVVGGAVSVDGVTCDQSLFR